MSLEKNKEEVNSGKAPPSYPKLRIPFFVGLIIIAAVLAGFYWMFFDFLKLLHLR